MNREANLRSRPAICVVLLFLAGAFWNCAKVRGEAQPEYPADGAVITGLEYEDNIYTTLDFIPGPNGVKHTGYFSDNYDDVANRAEDANLGEPHENPYLLQYRYYVGHPSYPPANDSLVRGTVYYWTVDERDAEGNILPGEIWRFGLQGFEAFAPSPPNEAILVDTNILLSWWPGYGVILHDVYISTSWEDVNNAVYDYFDPPPELLDTVSEPNLFLTGLEFNTKYYWRVDEVSSRVPPPIPSGPIYKGEVWSFTTAGGEAQPEFPADGELIDDSPLGDVVYTRLDFIPGAGAVEHTGYFSDNYDDVVNRIEDANLGPPPFAEEPGYEYRYYVGLPAGIVPGDPYSDGLVRGTTYYWTVDERDAIGNTFGGEIWEFTIRDFKATEPAPPNEATFVETDVLLSWLPGYGPSQHYVLMGTSWEDVNNAFLLPFPPPELLCTVSEPNVFVTGLELNTTYYWRVDEALWLPPPGGGFQYIYKGDVWCFTTKPSLIYVDVDAVGANNGASWVNAYNYLQDALIEAESALKPVEIWVAEGIYKPDRSAADPNGSGDRTATFQLINGVTLKGGYAGFGGSNPDAHDFQLYETILSGDLAGNDVDVNDPAELWDEPSRDDNSYHVLTGSGTDANAIVDGFTITGGNANGFEPDYFGGGMLINNGSPTVNTCMFRENSATSGGAIFIAGEGNSVVQGCLFCSNFAEESGGGAVCASDSASWSDCTFEENSTSWSGYGAGLCLISRCAVGWPSGLCPTSRYWVTDCKFISNESGYLFGFAGGMYVSGSISKVTNCIFNSNFSECGGGLLISSYLSPPWLDNPETVVTLINCTFTRNSASSGGGMGTSHKIDPQNDIEGLRAKVDLTNCVFTANIAEDSGGGMSAFGSDINITNCTLTGNLALNGKTLACDSYEKRYQSNVEITNSILWDTGYQLWNEDDSTIKIAYSDVQGGQSSVYDPCYGLIWSIGNIDSDPCFILSGYWADANEPNIIIEPNDPNAVWIDGDYHLSADSLCIDAGDPNFIDEPNRSEFDMDGGPRIIRGRIDMGCDEYLPCKFSDLNGDGIVDFKDYAIFANNWLEDSCSEPNWCERSDIDWNGKVDLVDLIAFAENWLWQQPKSVQWLIGQQNPVTGLLDSYEANGDIKAWLYDQTLAIIAFVEAGELDRARMILDRMTQLQLTDYNHGAWYQCYDSADLSICDNGLLTGPIAWMVIAINYYEYDTGDLSYAPLARNALVWLDTMRNTDPNDERYGSLKFSPDNLHIISTEHNVDAYSAYYWRGMLDSNESCLHKASLIKEYLCREMWAPSPDSDGPYHDVNIFWRGYEDFEFCTDPQCWTVLSLGHDSCSECMPLDWIWHSQWGNTRTIQDYNDAIKDVEGFYSCTFEPQHIWVGVTEGVAAAFYYCGQHDKGDQFHNQMSRTIANNGGLVHSFCENMPNDIRWPENYRYNHVESVAWYYFNEKRINPFNPEY